MSRLAQNGLSNGDASYQARLILEWPNQFEANQTLFSNVGYKNGSLPHSMFESFPPVDFTPPESEVAKAATGLFT